MSKIVNLNMSDEEYVSLLSQKSPSDEEQAYVKLLVCWGASPMKAERVARILTSPIALWLRKNLG
ncbi:hypothetical protein Chro_5976 (plasmid) [Chroococcidiopsis thermalis PCC 7203]|uniref:Uncharacterized protein n=1 Tax=Chroococcidiopsis thermalis (strain PCC 7203) TaxID=251229 RepID=K9U8C4_CHRTP|nr:hypothetical protein Chro_5976 [Chroococcidiopsis thermalis PCC 7203]